MAGFTYWEIPDVTIGIAPRDSDQQVFSLGAFDVVWPALGFSPDCLVQYCARFDSRNHPGHSGPDSERHFQAEVPDECYIRSLLEFESELAEMLENAAGRSRFNAGHTVKLELTVLKDPRRTVLVVVTLEEPPAVTTESLLLLARDNMNAFHGKLTMRYFTDLSKVQSLISQMHVLYRELERLQEVYRRARES